MKKVLRSFIKVSSLQKSFFWINQKEGKIIFKRLPALFLMNLWSIWTGRGRFAWTAHLGTLKPAIYPQPSNEIKIYKWEPTSSNSIGHCPWRKKIFRAMVWLLSFAEASFFPIPDVLNPFLGKMKKALFALFALCIGTRRYCRLCDRCLCLGWACWVIFPVYSRIYSGKIW